MGKRLPRGIYNARSNGEGTRAFLVLFRHDNTPEVLLSTIFDIDKPILEAQSDGSAFAAFASRDLNIMTAVMNKRDRTDKILVNYDVSDVT
jgi:hypothetical protein